MQPHKDRVRGVGKPVLLALTVAALSSCGVLGGKGKGPKTPVVGERVSILSTERDAVADLLHAQQTRRSAPAEALRATELLRNPRTVAVVTGQQAGLFGGPLYTLLKAVTTIQLARRISADHDVTAVPIFWVDGEEYILQAGDCITIDASRPHRAGNRSDAPAIVIAAITPPSF